MRSPARLIHGMSGLGWLPCLPFGYSPMTGEPISQCNSISDQVPCGAGVPEFPGNDGYCPSTMPGYDGLFQFAYQSGMAGLGDSLDLSASFGYTAPGGCVVGSIDPTTGDTIAYCPPAGGTVSTTVPTCPLGTPVSGTSLCPTGYTLDPKSLQCVPAGADTKTLLMYGGAFLALVVVVAMVARR